MKRAITTILAVALAIGMLASLAGPVAAQGTLSDVVMQTDLDSLGPLLELIARLFDISVSIEG